MDGLQGEQFDDTALGNRRLCGHRRYYGVPQLILSSCQPCKRANLVLIDLSCATADDVDEAVDSAEEGLKAWQSLSPVRSTAASGSHVSAS